MHKGSDLRFTTSLISSFTCSVTKKEDEKHCQDILQTDVYK